jgi:hypothetical protein
MDGYFEAEDRQPHDDDDDEGDGRPRARIADLPIDECDHSDLLQALIAEGAEAAMETFFEAKNPDIDPALKLKLINLASHVGDNVRKAIATHATHFGRQS